MDTGIITESLTALAAILAVAVAIHTINAKRKDDRRAARLIRINQQLSQFYGKLSVLNEVGVRHWYSFVYQYGNDNKNLGREFMRFFPYEIIKEEPITSFNPAPPNAEQMATYHKWLKNLFMETNEEILEVIRFNADLAIGKTMPNVLVAFAEHVSSLKMLLLKLAEEKKVKNNKFLNNWEEYVKLMAPHPTGLGNYINASFEILKEEQEKLLSTDDEPCAEQEIANNIRIRVWEKEMYWSKKEHDARASVGQHYEYKPQPKPTAPENCWRPRRSSFRGLLLSYLEPESNRHTLR